MAKMAIGQQLDQSRKFNLVFQQDEIKRVCLIDHELEVVRTHSVTDQNNRSNAVLCVKDLGQDCQLCKSVEPDYRFGVNVLVYTQPCQRDQAGNILVPGQWEIKIWTFRADKYAILERQKKIWGDLSQHDLAMTCKSSQFQELDIQPYPAAGWAQGELGNPQVFLQQYQAARKDVGAYLASKFRARRTPGAAPQGGFSPSPQAAPQYAPAPPPPYQPPAPVPSPHMVPAPGGPSPVPGSVVPAPGPVPPAPPVTYQVPPPPTTGTPAPQPLPSTSVPPVAPPPPAAPTTVNDVTRILENL